MASRGRVAQGNDPFHDPRMSAVPFEANAARRHHVPERRHRVTDRAAYDAALCRRGSLTVRVTDEAIWAGERRRARPGAGSPGTRRWRSYRAGTLRVLSRLALRRTEGLTGSILRLPGPRLAVPDHTTPSRRAEGLPGRGHARAAGRCTCLSTAPACACPPSGGSRSTARRKLRAWRKLRLGVDAEAGRIEAAELTDHETDDGSRVGPLLGRVAGPVASFTGDGAYDRGDVYGAVAKRHPEAAVLVPPRRDAVPSEAAEISPPGAIGTSGPSPSAAARAGRKPQGTIVALWRRQRCPATSGRSANAAVAHGPPPGGRHRRPGPEPAAGARPPGVRPHRVKPDGIGDNAFAR